MRKILSIPIAGLLFALIASVVVATTDVTSATFTASVVPQNTNTFAVKSLFPFPLSRPALIQSNVINENGLNLALCTAMDCSGAGVEVPFLGGPATSTVEYYFHHDASGAGSGWTNDTSDAQSETAADVLVFDADPENGDAVYYGFDTQQRIVQKNISTAGAGSWELAWSYSSVTSTTSSWNGLANVSDNTNSYMNAGLNEISWDLPLDWVSSTVNGQTAFWVRSEVTSTTSLITSPVGSQVFQEQGFFTAVATTTANQFNKNTERTLFMYAGGGTDLVSYNPLVVSRLEIDGDDPDLSTTDEMILSWLAYYGDESIEAIVTKGFPNDSQIDWVCSGGACGPTVFLETVTTDCDLSATSADWINREVEIRVRVNGSLDYCLLDIDGVQQDFDGNVNGNLLHNSDPWVWNFDNQSYMVSSTIDINSTTVANYHLGETVFASSTAYVSATPQLQNLGTLTDADANLSFVFESGFGGRTEPFEPVFTPDTLEQSGNIDIVPIIPTTTFATLTVPNPNLPLDDLIRPFYVDLGIGTQWFWSAIIIAICGAFAFGAAWMTRGNFYAVIVAAGLPLWIAIAPDVTIFPTWVPVAYSSFVALILFAKFGNVFSTSS